MAELKIPQKTLQDNFNLQDFKDDFNALNSEIEENKTLTDSEISKLKEIANTWETFKNTGGTIGGNIAVNGYVKSKENFYSTGTNDVGLMSDTSGVKYSSVSKILYPTLTDEITLGNSSLRWKDIYLNGINKNANGYTKLPNGLIMQWGKFTINLSGGGDNSSKITNCTFPIRFVNDVVNQGAICTYNLSSKGISWTSAINCSAMVNSLSEITIESRAINSSTPNNNFEIRWFAIGY